MPDPVIVTVRCDREELVDEISDVLSDACDMDVTWGQYAEAVVRCLERITAEKGVIATCPVCHREEQAASSGGCDRAGCPLGADR